MTYIIICCVFSIFLPFSERFVLLFIHPAIKKSDIIEAQTLDTDTICPMMSYIAVLLCAVYTAVYTASAIMRQMDTQIRYG